MPLDQEKETNKERRLACFGLKTLGLLFLMAMLLTAVAFLARRIRDNYGGHNSSTEEDDEYCVPFYPYCGRRQSGRYEKAP